MVRLRLRRLFEYLAVYPFSRNEIVCGAGIGSGQILVNFLSLIPMDSS